MIAVFKKHKTSIRTNVLNWNCFSSYFWISLIMTVGLTRRWWTEFDSLYQLLRFWYAWSISAATLQKAKSITEFQNLKEASRVVMLKTTFLYILLVYSRPLSPGEATFLSILFKLYKATMHCLKQGTWTYSFIVLVKKEIVATQTYQLSWMVMKK